jgi:hypothetical protein
MTDFIRIPIKNRDQWLVLRVLVGMHGGRGIRSGTPFSRYFRTLNPLNPLPETLAMWREAVTPPVGSNQHSDNVTTARRVWESLRMTSEPDDKQLMADLASTNQRKHRSIERLMSNLVYGDHIGWAAAEFNLVQAGLIKMIQGFEPASTAQRRLGQLVVRLRLSGKAALLQLGPRPPPRGPAGAWRAGRLASAPAGSCAPPASCTQSYSTWPV